MRVSKVYSPIMEKVLPFARIRDDLAQVGETKDCLLGENLSLWPSKYVSGASDAPLWYYEKETSVSCSHSHLSRAAVTVNDPWKSQSH